MRVEDYVHCTSAACCKRGLMEGLTDSLQLYSSLFQIPDFSVPSYEEEKATEASEEPPAKKAKKATKAK